MRPARFSFVLACTLLACSDEADAPRPACADAPPEQKETCLTSHYFEGASPETQPPCAGFTPSAQKIGGRREVSLFTGLGVSDGDVAAEGRGLQRFYRTYDLTFFTRAPARQTFVVYALAGTDAELAAAVEKAGVPPGTRPTAEQQEQVDRFVGDVLFADLRRFVLGESSPPKALVNIVVLEQIASPDVAKLFKGGVIGGLGLSPKLFADIAATDPNKNLFELLALPAEFTPTLFVGHDDIVRLARNPEGIVAHEMGHAMGLQHTTEPGNLMTQSQSSVACTAGLTDEQVDALRGAAGALLETEGFRALFEAHRAIVDAVVAKNARLRR